MNQEAFLTYKTKIDEQLAKEVEAFGPKSKLRDAIAYTLGTKGKRFRPILVMLIAEALGNGLDVMAAALSVEYFHSASLIADDLPSMDNDDLRRNKPSTHKVYGEAVALLASYTLIAAGYDGIAKAARRLEKEKTQFSANAKEAGLLALENVACNNGLSGATGGQFLDMFPDDISFAGIKEVIFKKTVTFFESSFVLGWLFGGGAFDSLDLVKKAAYHFGMAFQIADDLGDAAQDKACGRAVNIANLLGKDKAEDLLKSEVQEYLETIKELKIDSPALKEIGKKLLAML